MLWAWATLVEPLTCPRTAKADFFLRLVPSLRTYDLRGREIEKSFWRRLVCESVKTEFVAKSSVRERVQCTICTKVFNNARGHEAHCLQPSKLCRERRCVWNIDQQTVADKRHFLDRPVLARTPSPILMPLPTFVSVQDMRTMDANIHSFQDAC